MTEPTQLLFLPGAGGNPQFWQPVADQLTSRASKKLLGWPGLGVVPPDPRVNGLGDLVSLVLNAIDQPSALIAQSMGGVVALQVALQVALERPDRLTHLVLAVTSGGVDMSDLQAQDWRPAFVATNPTAARWLVDYNEDISEKLLAIKIPVLLLWGDADPISPVAVGERLQRLIPQARLHVVPGGGHDLAQKHAAQVAPLIDAHLLVHFSKPLESEHV